MMFCFVFDQVLTYPIVIVTLRCLYLYLTYFGYSERSRCLALNRQVPPLDLKKE